MELQRAQSLNERRTHRCPTNVLIRMQVEIITEVKRGGN